MRGRHSTDWSKVLDYIRTVSVNGEAFVTQQELATATGESVSNMWYALAALERAGLADVRPVRGTFVTLKGGA